MVDADELFGGIRLLLGDATLAHIWCLISLAANGRFLRRATALGISITKGALS